MSNYGAADCDAAFAEFGIDCATLEANYQWDCTGCACPGDSEAVCGDGFCTGEESYDTCPEDCLAPGECPEGQVLDCDGSNECHPESWIGDGFGDCEDQEYGADLTCYDNDGGDCDDVVIGAGCTDASACNYDETATEDDGSCVYADGISILLDCVGTCFDATLVSWVGDGYCDDGTDQGWTPILDLNCEEYSFDDGDCSTCVPGDVNADETVNVLDIVATVNYILEGGDTFAVDCADVNADGSVNVLDIVATVNFILEGRNTDATSANLIKTGNALSLNADGYIGGVQMTLSHGLDFSLELTDKAMVADYRTNGNSTTLVIVAPQSDELFIAEGSYEIVDMIVANSAGQMDVNVVPTSFVLSEAYPNPFNPSTSVNLSIPEAGYVSVQVYNVMGQLVSTLADGYMDASVYSFTWNASSVPSGVYLVTATAANQTSTQKVMLLK